MTRAASLLTAFLAGVLVALLGGVLLRPVQAEAPISISSTSTPLPTVAVIQTEAPTLTHAVSIPSAAPTPTRPAQIAAAGGAPFGWAGQVQCWNCSPFSVRVELHHYNPQNFNPDFPRLNCWEYSNDHKYCLSPTWIGVPWDAVWGFGAACSPDWFVGSWVDIAGVGAFICFDHGQDIICDYTKGICRVDILGPGGADWDGKTFDATLWVPTSKLLKNQEAK